MMTRFRTYSPRSSYQPLECRRLMSAAAIYPDPVDNDPPEVDAVFVNGTQWSPAFRSYLADNRDGSTRFGFETNSSRSGEGGGEYDDRSSRILPWINLDQVSIRFDENVQVQQDDLEITGVRTRAYDVAAFAYDAEAFVATWTLDEALPADLVTLRLDGTSATGVTDLAGNPLNGNDRRGDDGNDGGGVPHGRDYVQVLAVLPGDVNRSGAVLANDFSEVKRKFFSSTANEGEGRARYTIFHDVDGSGAILANDFSEVKKRFFSRLPEEDDGA